MAASRVAIAVVVFASSAWPFGHFFGVDSLLVLAAWSAAAAVAVDAAARRLSWTWAVRAVWAIGFVALILFVVVYPRVDVHDPARGGSDRDDDADAAVIAAAHGKYPFEVRTYLDHPITHLPGSLLVAAPFVATGGSARENVLVLPIAAWLLARRYRSAEALVLVVGTAAASAGVWQEFLTGGNSLAEWTILSVALVWFIERERDWRRAAVFGFALNTRANAISAVGSIVGVASRRGIRRAVPVAFVVVTVQAALVAPFLLRGYQRFSPFTGGAEKFAHLDRLFAHASTVLPLAAVAVSTSAAFLVSRTLRFPAVAALGGLAISQAAQFAALMGCSLAAGSTVWAGNWSSYFTIAVIPASGAIALQRLASTR